MRCVRCNRASLPTAEYDIIKKDGGVNPAQRLCDACVSLTAVVFELKRIPNTKVGGTLADQEEARTWAFVKEGEEGPPTEGAGEGDKATVAGPTAADADGAQAEPPDAGAEEAAVATKEAEGEGDGQPASD